MRIYQLVPSLLYGDGVGNAALNMDKVIREMGYETAIFADYIDKRIPKGIAYSYDELQSLDENDVLIYHFASGSKIMKYIIRSQKCIKVMVYHNVTPPQFFEGYNKDAVMSCRSGIRDMQSMKDDFDYCIAVSEYNKQGLIEAGYKCPVFVVPVIMDFSDYDKEINTRLFDKYSDGYINWAFIGRISPNKRQEDIIKAFAYYQKHINKKSRLFLVGNYSGVEKYYFKLLYYTKELGVENVFFTGHTSFKNILTYYRLADVFVCMSEHEGLCIPLLEAMKMQVPIVAFSSSAIPETLGNAGVVVDSKNSAVIAEIVDTIVSDQDISKRLVLKEQQRLKDFSYDVLSKRLKSVLVKIINGEKLDMSSDDQKGIISKEPYEEKIAAILNRPLSFYKEDDVINFENIKISEAEILQHSDLKEILKKCFLRPCYHGLKAIAPELAGQTKKAMYSVWHKIK